jgi:putative hydrolase of the HAD superfamily
MAKAANAPFRAVLRSKAARGYRVLPPLPAIPESPRPVRAVLFDAGNTLFFETPSRFEIYTAAARELGLEVELERVRRVMHEEHGRVTPDAGAARYTDAWFERYVPAVYRSLGASEPMLVGLVARLRERYRRTAVIQLFPETARVLEELRKVGIRLGIVSNWSPRLRNHLERLSITPLFDAVLISAIEGVEKPDPEIFHRACARLGVEPNETIHVGDHRVNDVDGANRAGLRGVWIDREGRGDGAPPRGIRSLDALLPLIGAVA